MPFPAGLAYRVAMLDARDLVVVREGSRTVLDGVSLRLEEGDWVSLEGPSGGGKSTLLWALARLIPRRSGRMALDGTPPDEVPVREWRRRVSLLVQKPALAAATVRENLTLPYALGVRSRARAPEIPDAATLRAELDALGLDDVELDRLVAELSVGQAGRVAFLQVILTRPDHLLLDEPAAALDPETAAGLHARIERYVASGGSALIVRHHDGGGNPDRVLRLEGGRVEETTP